jgi:hypothetical protein
MEISEEFEEIVKRHRLIRTECDWCGAVIPNPGAYYTVDFTLEFLEGSSYPEGGYQEGWRVEDLCKACVGKLEQLLKDNGIRVVPAERDW